MIQKIIQFLVLFLSLSLSFSFVHADVTASIKLTPINPAPKSSVTLTLESYSFDVNTAMITWKIEGGVVLEGMGEKKLTIKTGDVGNTTRVNVLAKTADGNSIEQKISITPSSIVLLYEAPKSYVPRFYEGRSLPSVGALVRVSALPQISDTGAPLPPSSLSFTWYLNDSVMKSMSGLGKQTASVRLDYLKDKNTIKVVARSPLGNTGTKTITVYSHAIMPLLYLHDPLFGPNLKKIIGKRFETIQDFSLALEPFYVSQRDPKDPSYSWFIDGLPSTPIGGRVLEMRPKENSYGTKMLTIKVSGPDKRIQNAETKLEILFDTRK